MSIEEPTILEEEAIPCRLPMTDSDYLYLYLIEIPDSRRYYVVACSEDLCIWFPFRRRGFKSLRRARRFLEKLELDLLNSNMDSIYVRLIAMLLVDRYVN